MAVEGWWSVRRGWRLGVRRRDMREVALRRDFVSRGVVLSLWRDSCGCWIIMICVAVGIGKVGITWQRQTGSGRLQLVQFVRRRCNGSGFSDCGSKSIFGGYGGDPCLYYQL